VCGGEGRAAAAGIPSAPLTALVLAALGKDVCESLGAGKPVVLRVAGGSCPGECMLPSSSGLPPSPVVPVAADSTVALL
jgi:hypothetical protein